MRADAVHLTTQRIPLKSPSQFTVVGATSSINITSVGEVQVIGKSDLLCPGCMACSFCFGKIPPCEVGSSIAKTPRLMSV